MVRQMLVSTFASVKAPTGGTVTLDRWFEAIRSDRFAPRVANFRATGDLASKHSLPAITPSAAFDGPRSYRSQWHHSGVLVFDLDHVVEDERSFSWHVVDNEPHAAALSRTLRDVDVVAGAHRSPSVDGLKVFVRVGDRPADARQHRHAWQTARNVLLRARPELERFLDESGKDVARLCFASHDPDAWLRDSVPVRVDYRQVTDADQPAAPLNASLSSIVEHLAYLDNHDYQTWIKVGMALHHETGGSADGFSIWSSWSARSYDGFDIDDLHRRWVSFTSTDTPVTVRSIIAMSAEAVRHLPPVKLELGW